MGFIIILYTARKTDQEMTDIVKTVCYTHRSWEKGACHTTGDHMRNFQIGEEAEGGGNHRQEPLLWFLWEGNDKDR